MRDGIYEGWFLTNHGVSAIHITCEPRLSRDEKAMYLFRSAPIVEVEGRPREKKVAKGDGEEVETDVE